MLDAVADFIERGEHEQAREILDKALGRARERRSASCATSRSISSRSSCATTASRWPSTRSAGPRHRARDRGRARRRRCRGARRARRRRRCTRSCARRSRRRSGAAPRRASTVASTGRGRARSSLTIRDDAPSERRRRSLEVLEERARTLGATLDVEHEDGGTTMSLVLPVYAVSASKVPRAMTRQAPPLRLEALRLRAARAGRRRRPPSAPRSSRTASSCASRSSRRRRCPATSAQLRVPLGVALASHVDRLRRGEAEHERLREAARVAAASRRRRRRRPRRRGRRTPVADARVRVHPQAADRVRHRGGDVDGDVAGGVSNTRDRRPCRRPRARPRPSRRLVSSSSTRTTRAAPIELREVVLVPRDLRRRDLAPVVGEDARLSARRAARAGRSPPRGSAPAARA